MSDEGITYEKLIAYAAGDLPAAEAAGVDRYLRAHPAAAATVQRYRLAREALLTDDGTEPSAEAVAAAREVFRPRPRRERESWLDQAAHAVVRLIYDSRRQPALAGLRGGPAAFELAYELPGAELELQLEPHGEHYRLVGQLGTADGPAQAQITACPAGTDQPACSAGTDERGVFLMQLAPGTWDLHVGLPGGTTVVPDIRIE